MLPYEEFTLFKTEARRRYDSIRSPVHCRCLNQDVHFNATGFHHLLYNGSGKARSILEARAKLVLIPLIVPTIKIATNSSYEKRYVRKNRKADSGQVKVEMWGIEAIVSKFNSIIRVILRRENEGKIIFWSVMKRK